MKKLFLLLFLAGAVTWVGCGNGNDENNGEDGQEVSVPEELKDYDPLTLEEYGLPLEVWAPDTTVGMPEIEEQPTGALHVRVGDYYMLSINDVLEGEGLEHKKKMLQEDLLWKVTILDEGDNFIRYKSELPDGSNTFHHFYCIVDVNGRKMEVTDIEEGESIPEKSIIRMLEAAKFIQVKPLKQEEPAEQENA